MAPHANGDTNEVKSAANADGKLDFTTFYNTIDGKLTSTATTRHNINPATSKPNPEVPVSGQEDVDKAVQAARKAFKTWSKTPRADRVKAILGLADGLAAEKEQFANMLTREQGKPLPMARMEVDSACRWLRANCDFELHDEVIEDTDYRQVVTHYYPLGVVVGIIPWNVPLHLCIGKLAPAVLTGNTMIVKPSPYTPYSDLKMVELAQRFFPSGVIQAVSGDESLGPRFTTHPDVNKISFTGSVPTGKKVMEAASKTLKRVTLELGGNDAAIVCADVDIDEVAPKMATQAFVNSGQICVAVKRIYVHESIYDKFRDAMVKHTKTLKVGDGMEPGVTHGPVQNAMQYDIVKGFFADIEKENWKVAIGGKVDSTPGYFINPTQVPLPFKHVSMERAVFRVSESSRFSAPSPFFHKFMRYVAFQMIANRSCSIIDNPGDDSRIVREEPFGPIVPLLPWKDEDEVIARANNVKVGLGGSVWTRDLKQARRIAEQIESGAVWVNAHRESAPNIPFGGNKESGIGVEWGIEGMKGYCNSQRLFLKKQP